MSQQNSYGSGYAPQNVNAVIPGRVRASSEPHEIRKSLVHTVIEVPRNLQPGDSFPPINRGVVFDQLPMSGMGIPRIDTRGLSPISAKLIQRGAPIAHPVVQPTVPAGAPVSPSGESLPRPSPVVEPAVQPQVTMSSAVPTKPDINIQPMVQDFEFEVFTETPNTSLQLGQAAKELFQLEQNARNDVSYAHSARNDVPNSYAFSFESGSSLPRPPDSVTASTPTASPSPTRVMGVSFDDSPIKAQTPFVRTPGASPLTVRYPASQSVPPARVVQRLVDPFTPQTVTRAVAPPAFYPQPQPTAPVYLQSQVQPPRQVVYHQPPPMYHAAAPPQPKQFFIPPQSVPQPGHPRSQSVPANANQFMPIPVNVDMHGGNRVATYGSDGNSTDFQAANTPVRSYTAHFGTQTDDLLQRVDRVLEEEERASEPTDVECGPISSQPLLAQFGHPKGRVVYQTEVHARPAPVIPQVVPDTEAEDPFHKEVPPYSFAGSTTNNSPDLQAQPAPHKERTQIEKRAQETPSDGGTDTPKSSSKHGNCLPCLPKSSSKHGKNQSKPVNAQSATETEEPVNAQSDTEKEAASTMTHMADTQRDTVLAVTALASSISASSNALSKRIEELEFDVKKENFKNESARDVVRQQIGKPRSISPDVQRQDTIQRLRGKLGEEPDQSDPLSPRGREFSFARYRAVVDLSLPSKGYRHVCRESRPGDVGWARYYEFEPTRRTQHLLRCASLGVMIPDADLAEKDAVARSHLHNIRCDEKLASLDRTRARIKDDRLRHVGGQ